MAEMTEKGIKLKDVTEVMDDMNFNPKVLRSSLNSSTQS